jgi:signal transduction histidine kinase
VEAWLVGILVFALVMPTLQTAPGLVVSTAFLLVAGVASAWAGLRRSITPARWQDLPREALFGLELAVGFILLLTLTLTASNQLDLPTRANLGVPVVYLFLALSGPGYLLVRAFGWVYLVFDDLRRRHFAWALTSALLTVLAGIGLLGLLFSIFYTGQFGAQALAGVPAESVLSRMVIWACVLIAICTLFVLIAVVLFLPFSLFFSYRFSRRLTRRVEQLSQTATALQNGDLSVRSPVQGEDEIAALQTSFNHMAANLQRSTSELAQERDRVATLLQAQRELTAGVSHELRTPVATISGSLEVVLRRWETLSPAQARHEVEVAAREAARLQTLMSDLLLLSQAEAERLSLRIEPVDAGALVKRAVETTAGLAWERQRVQVVAEVAANLPLVQADALRLEQCLLNLLQNAIRHTPAGGVVVATACTRGQVLRLEVIDTGAGISAEDLPHIWEKFYRAKGETVASGNGLGLALVQEFCQAMGAVAGVESTLGQGSQFWIEFPLPQ